jgi:hypothetical protein
LKLSRLVFRLRPEEAVALAFVLPTTWLTVAGYLYAREAGVLGARYPGGVVRLAAVVALLGSLALALRRWPGSPLVRGLRETVPLLACFLIYTNLHDTIGFVNPHDVHHYLVALDQMIFGVQPCVWAERLITPARTEAMQLLYLNFFWIAPSTSLFLLLRRRWPEFRAATLGIVTCFFLGYALYVAFPAAPPRLVLVYEFTKNLRGYPVGFSNLSAQAFALLPVDSRAAFPSLHTAASRWPSCTRGGTSAGGSGSSSPSCSASGPRRSTSATTTSSTWWQAGCSPRRRCGSPRGSTSLVGEAAARARLRARAGRDRAPRGVSPGAPGRGGAGCRSTRPGRPRPGSSSSRRPSARTRS